MDDDDETCSLWWFEQLLIDDQVTLLANPHQPLNADLIDRWQRRQGASGRPFWKTNPETGSTFVDPDAAAELDDRREQLELCWKKFCDKQQQHIIDNRDGELEAAVYEPPWPVAKRPETPSSNLHRFRLLPIDRVFVEMKAASRPESPVTKPAHRPVSGDAARRD